MLPRKGCNNSVLLWPGYTTAAAGGARLNPLKGTGWLLDATVTNVNANQRAIVQFLPFQGLPRANVLASTAVTVEHERIAL
jgi:hypothetical protein